LHVEAGIATGTKFVPGLANFVPGAAPGPEELEQMAVLYAFDMLVQNPDRRLDNPNCGVLDGKLVPFDFEMCFSFLMALGDPDPCAISNLGLAGRHCCHEVLRARKSSVSWKPVLDALRSLTNKELQQIITAVPLEWQNAAERVRSHMNTILRQLDIIEMELQRSLG
jgi:hypothetical protein